MAALGATCTLDMNDVDGEFEAGDGWNEAEWAAPGFGQTFSLAYGLSSGTESFVVPPPPGCAKVTLKTTGWQMLSFNCIGNMSNTFAVLEDAPWRVDDKILTRDLFLKFATFDGEKFVGGLVLHDQLSMSLGYKIFYSGAPGAILEQTGLPQLPMENVTLHKGWNWIGHAPLASYRISTGITTVGSDKFSIDDQIKTRSGSDLSFTTYDNKNRFQGGLLKLEPGVGYEVKVAQAVTFRYTTPQHAQQP